MHRRTALRELARGTAAAALTTLAGHPAAAAVAGELARAGGPRPAAPGGPVRVRGRVTSTAGRGVARVAVSDGLAVVETDADGRFTLVSDGRRRRVFVCVPAGYALPGRAPNAPPDGGSAGGGGRLVRADAPVAPDARGEAEARFVLAPLAAPETRHRLLLLADPQTQNRFETGRLHAETVPDVAATVRAGGGVPTFGVACGDIMYDDLALYPEWERAVARMGVPFVQVAGNHDLDQGARTHEGSTATFEGRYGPASWSFDRGDVHYVVLHDVFWHGAGYVGYLGADPLAWLAADLARVERGRTVVVCTHIPPHSTRAERAGERGPTPGESVTNREALYELLAPYRAHVLSGHTHEHEHLVTERGGAAAGTRHEHVHGAVCGAWWSGDVCWDGAPNGYGVYDVRGEEVRWRYKGTGLADDVRLRVYGPGADPAQPAAVVANVWDWDPAWRVTWSEDGEPRGEMRRAPGLDPRARAEQTGPDRPPRRAWVEPAVTGHLFAAAPRPGAREVRVEAVDRWGARWAAGWTAAAPAPR